MTQASSIQVKLSGRAAMVTGSTKGIGLAACGARVAVKRGNDEGVTAALICPLCTNVHQLTEAPEPRVDACSTC